MKKRHTTMSAKWDRRFLRLTNKRVTWFKNEPKPKKSKKAKTSKRRLSGTRRSSSADDSSNIKASDIEMYTGITPFINHTNNKYGFVITTNSKVVKFQTETLLECQEWVICLNEVVLDAHRGIELSKSTEKRAGHTPSHSLSNLSQTNSHSKRGSL